MGKCFSTKTNLEDLRDRIVIFKEKDDKKTVVLVLAVVAAILALVSIGVVLAVKSRMDDEYDEEWDYDWEDLEDEYCDDEECHCTDSDVDDTVKVEQL